MTAPTTPAPPDASAAGPTAELAVLARQALTDSPAYIANIAATLTSCTREIRAGEDRAGLAHFARGASDLEQFLLLFEHVASVAQPGTEGETASFRRALHDGVRTLESRLVAEDLTGLCDAIEEEILPVLPRWTEVAAEIDRGFTARGL